LLASSPVSVIASALNSALCVAPPAAIAWHWRHQHWRIATGLPLMANFTAPHRHWPV
jgi:hypothetical protein